MILPTRFLAPETSVLRVAADVLAALGAEGVLKVQDLRSRVLGELPVEAGVNFSPALSLLYLLGAVDYDLASDSLVRRDRPVDED